MLAIDPAAAQGRLLLANALKWLMPEIDASLARVRVQIESQQEADGHHIETGGMVEELSLVRGALTLAGCHGGALLAEEIQAAVAAVGTTPVAEPLAALAAASGATLQLSDYLDALLRDAPDCAAVLQPAISELRLATGRKAATEADLFVEQMRRMGLRYVLADPAARKPGAAAVVAGKLLPAFQALLLQWLKGVDAENSLVKLRKVGDHLAANATLPQIALLWSAFAAAVDSLLASPHADALELKRWFGRMGQPMKTLAEQGEEATVSAAGETAWRLMAHAARIGTGGERWAKLITPLALDGTLPVEAALATARRQLRGPNTRLLEKVAAEVRADLTLVKDNLDLALRAGGLTSEGQDTIRARLKRVASTLALLGLPQLEQVLLNQAGEIATLGSGGDGQWMRVATALLRVEYSLEGALFKPLRSTQSAAEPGRELVEITPHSQDLRESIAALLREMLVDLAKLKAQLDAYLKGTELRDAAEPVEMLAEVTSGLIVLDRMPAAELSGRLRSWLAEAGAAELRNDPAIAVRFAESVAALEIYLEALRDQLPHPERVLETLSEALDFFEAADALASLDVPTAIPEPVAEAPAPDAHATVDLPLDEAEPAADSTPVPEPEAAIEAEAAAPADGEALPETAGPTPALEALPLAAPVAEAASAPPSPAPPAGDDDPEIRDIFIEEAGEVRDTLKRILPVFHRDPQEPETLSEIRRAFHTLKGSGRMVGARRIGELGWAVEHLLNRCIEGALPINTAVVHAIDSALGLLPALLDEFREGGTGREDDDAHALTARAHYLASGRAPEMVEAEVIEVFRADALDRLADIERWLASDPGLPVEADAVRALHTIKGSAAVVNAEGLSQLSGAFEGLLRPLMQAGIAAPPEVRAVVQESLHVLRDWAARAGETSLPPAGEWLLRVEALRAFLPPLGDSQAPDAREVVAINAFDQLQGVEQALIAWMANPREPQLADAMAAQCAALAATAAPCAPLARGAQAMAERLAAADLDLIAAAPPDTGFFQSLANALEYFYRFLDSYREGGSRENGRQLAEQIATLALHTVVPEPGTESDEIGQPAAPAAAAEAAPESGSATESALIAEIESLVLPPPVPLSASLSEFRLTLTPSTVDTTVQAEPLPLLLQEPRLAFEAALAEPLPDLLDPAALAVAEPAGADAVPAEPSAELETLEVYAIPHAVPEPPLTVDAELAAIFVEEARELLPQLGADLAGWQPPDAPAEPVRRALHTLAGSSRMAGYLRLGDMAQGFERRLESLLPGAAANAVVRADLLAALPVFDEAIEVFAAMAAPEAASDAPVPEASLVAAPPAATAGPALPAPILGDDYVQALDPAATTGSSLLDDGIGDDAIGEPPAFDEPAPTPGTGPVPAEAPAPTSTSTPTSIAEPAAELPPPVERPRLLVPEMAQDEPAATIDPELAAIFSAEAAEMLETIGGSLAAWQRKADDSDAIAELQRALHTLKGGARMTGLMAMGEVSHEMESKVSELLRRTGAPGAADHAWLMADLEILERMHDSLLRGHYAAAPEALPLPEAQAQDDSTAYDTETAPAETAPVSSEWDPALFWRPEEDANLVQRRELARVPVERLDAMLNEAGEISIYRSRLEQQNASLAAQLAEMRQTVVRLREQLRQMDAETDAQIAARGLDARAMAEARDHYGQDFDPLEMDRYSRMQELSRALAESVGDLDALHLTMDQGVNEGGALLVQQGRINSAVQQSLMGTLMVPFSRQVARLQRVVRQVAEEEGKSADVVFEGVESELDRNVLERMTAPLEHLLRNAVVHGLESPEGRAAAGKSAMGLVRVLLKREGTQLAMEISDDGKGLDLAAIRKKAQDKGLMPANATLGDDELARFIFETGFSTASQLTQTAGRGVGMDVVASEVKQLGGTLELRSETGQGTRFVIRLPLSLALSQALMVRVGEETYALPLAAIEGVARVPRADALSVASGGEATVDYADHSYRVRTLAELLGLTASVPEDTRTLPAVLVRLGEGIAGGERRAALLVDALPGNREVVSKAVGPQLSSISGIAGATILPDGGVVLILDPAALVTDHTRRRLLAQGAEAATLLTLAPPEAAQSGGRLIMVVDDSVTMRRVAERLLVRNGYRVLTARDGLEAIGLLQHESPAAILLDIEMPRADGFEVAGFVRGQERIRETPIVMITSRSGDKHRARAATLGVDRYLIKPYQEEQLLSEIRGLLQSKEAEAA